MNMFRTLRADEIDCRVAQIKEKDGKPSGLSILLYKDARCDQNILDEVVGPFKWKREHTRDNRNCIVSIWSDELGQWISKEDTGTESNTEREKGLASDSFKRACFNWGIGRELYTAPFVWVPADKCTPMKKGANGKWQCYDRFTVKGIGYKDGVITGLKIKNQATGKLCYEWGEINEQAPEKPEQPDTEPDTPSRPAENVTVTTAPTLPPPTPEAVYLLNVMKKMREARGCSTEENKKIFKEQHVALIRGGLAPDKLLQEYTLPELENLIDAMEKNFSIEGVRG